MSLKTKSLYDFGLYRLDADERVLLLNGEVVPLAPKAIDLLLALVENGGHVVSKDELMKQVWPDSYVEEANLSHLIYTLRKALGEDKNGAKYIETIPRRGYRFVVDVRADADDLIFAEHSRIVVEQLETSESVNDTELQESRRAFSEGEKSQTVAGINKRLAFRALTSGVAALALAIPIYLWITANSRSEDAALNVRSMAVLPFKPLVADSRDEYLELGLADALIARLSNLKEISVRPTSAMIKYSTGSLTPLEIGREQQVDVVLEGQFQKAGDRIRATVQLVKVSDGKMLWAETFENNITSIFAVQDLISTRVAKALTLTLTGAEQQRLVKHHTDSVEAYELYMRGQYSFSKWTEEGLNKALEYYKQAVEKDPGYAQAYAGLAKCHHVFGVRSLPAKEAFLKSKDYALKSLELDDTLPEAHATLALAKAAEWDWLGAEKELKRSIELNPNYAEGHDIYAQILMTMRRMDEALAEIRLARALDPLSLSIIGGLGNILYNARKYDEAIAQYRSVIELYPDQFELKKNIALSYAQQALHEKAIAEMREALALCGESEKTSAGLAFIYAIAGKRAEAKIIVTSLEELSKRTPIPPLVFARVYTGLGEKDKAFEWLEKAFKEHTLPLGEINPSPDYDNIRSDARFGDLLRRIGLAP